MLYFTDMRHVLLLATLLFIGAGCLSRPVAAPAPKNPPPSDGVFCTQDVKSCPGGGYVSRVPPSCEFAPCP